MGRLHVVGWCMLLLLGCDPAPIPDVGPDAGDAGLSDAPLDAPPDVPPPSPFCQPCRRDADCEAGAFCTVFADGVWACTVGCSTDDDCASLSLPSTCAAEGVGLPLGCRPAAGSCAVSEAGLACGVGCVGIYDVCAEPTLGLGSYCTTACDTDADCPMGLRRCDRGLCVRDAPSPPETCAALLVSAPLAACGAGRSCAAGSLCVGDSDPRCFAVPTDDGCPGSNTVVRMVGAQPVCVPHAGADFDATPRVADCECMLDDGGLFDEVTALAGRSRCELGFSHALFELYPPELTHDVMRLSFTDPVHSYWPAAPRFAASVASSVDDLGGPEVLFPLAELADLSVQGPATPTPDADASARLGELVEAAGGTAASAAITAALSGVTDARAFALAQLFTAMRHALEMREAAIATYVPLDRTFLYEAPSGLFLPGIGFAAAPSSVLIGAMRGDVDVGAMASAALEVLAAAREVERTFASLGTTGLGAFSATTPIGTIAFGSAGDDTYMGAPYASTLLILEPGGNDTYRAPVGATASAQNGVSVLLDLGGVDDYGYVEVAHPSDVGPLGHVRLPSDGAGRVPPAGGSGPYTRSSVSRQGAGRLGIGLLLDLGAEGDHYRSLRMSQGYGALGIGVLFDGGGDDLYEGEAGMQGAAVAGVGLLFDAGGTDRYVTYHASQGFGYVRGVGALYDASGDDTYFAHPSDVLYFSPQSATSNSSFVQGVGFGRRDDGGGIYMSGGLGVLRDRAGDDRYTCGLFCQASGYWFGTGLLLEGAGADHYDGQWYVQAGNAHFATSVLLDASGNDVFNETAIRMNAAVAGGHDFSSAWLIDRAGDDVFHAPGLTLGTGHAGGFGAFLDLGGTDSYDTFSDLSFGNASIETPGDALRRMSGTVGIFLERGGTDTYVRPTPMPVANEATWTQSAHMGESENGAGLDRDLGMVGAGLD